MRWRACGSLKLRLRSGTSDNQKLRAGGCEIMGVGVSKLLTTPMFNIEISSTTVLCHSKVQEQKLRVSARFIMEPIYFYYCITYLVSQ